MAAPLTSKRCTECKVTKPLTDFSKQAHATGGVSSKCRACHRQKYYRKAKAEEIAAGTVPALAPPESPTLPQLSVLELKVTEQAKRIEQLEADLAQTLAFLRAHPALQTSCISFSSEITEDGRSATITIPPGVKFNPSELVLSGSIVAPTPEEGKQQAIRMAEQLGQQIMDAIADGRLKQTK